MHDVHAPCEGPCASRKKNLIITRFPMPHRYKASTNINRRAFTGENRILIRVVEMYIQKTGQVLQDVSRRV